MRFVICTALASLLLAATPGMASASTAADTEAYATYCSACHGRAADGNGPVANVLQPRPPALTDLRKKYGKPLGTKLVAFISGSTMPRAHGASDMPVWGRVLTEDEGLDARDSVETLWGIVSYLDSIQQDD